MHGKPEIRSFAAEVEATEVAAELERNGCAIVRERAPADLMDRVRDQLQPYLDDAPRGRTDFAGRTSRRRNGLLAKSEGCRELAVDPVVLGVCDHLLLPHCVNYRLHVTALVELLPGEVQQGIHRDGTLYPVRHPAPVMTVAAFWAYTEFTESNGATLVAPGSHRWAHEREPEPAELVQAVMPRGSVLLYSSSVWHGSGANRSNAARTGLAIHYNLGWLRQEENQVLSAPPQVAKHFGERLQRLIGYDLGGPYLGFVEEGNPLRLLEEPVVADHARTEPELEQRHQHLEPLVLSVPPPAGAGE